MANTQSCSPGELICSTKALAPHSIPSWGMYLISAGCTFLAVMFLMMAIEAFMSKLRGTTQAGVVLLIIGLIFLACGVAAFVSGRKTSKARNVRFHTNGVVVEASGEETFIPYANADEITIELIDPSDATKGKAIARAALSLAVGNAVGIGYAIGKSRSTGIVEI